MLCYVLQFRLQFTIDINYKIWVSNSSKLYFTAYTCSKIDIMIDITMVLLRYRGTSCCHTWCNRVDILMIVPFVCVFVAIILERQRVYYGTCMNLATPNLYNNDAHIPPGSQDKSHLKSVILESKRHNKPKTPLLKHCRTFCCHHHHQIICVNAILALLAATHTTEHKS